MYEYQHRGIFLAAVPNTMCTASDPINEINLLCRLQAQTLPDEAPPIGKIQHIQQNCRNFLTSNAIQMPFGIQNFLKNCISQIITDLIINQSMNDIGVCRAPPGFAGSANNLTPKCTDLLQYCYKNKPAAQAAGTDPSR